MPYRLLIALFLALTLPLQGMASVTTGICMSLGHHQSDMSAQHDHGAEGHETNHGHDSDHGASHGDDGDSAHCAPCVACCAAASISPAAPVFLPQDPPAAAVAVVRYLHPRFLPEKLDRPPLAL
jgi:hypothetical protein